MNGPCETDDILTLMLKSSFVVLKIRSWLNEERRFLNVS
jgi:hypothetical protein